MFDAAGDKQKKIQEKRRAEAKKKLQEEKRKEQLAEDIESRKRQKELGKLEEARYEQERAKELLSKTGGISLHLKGLKIVPDKRIDDKIILPASCMELLNQQSVFDRAGGSGVLTFEVMASFTSRQNSKTKSVGSITGANSDIEAVGGGSSSNNNTSGMDVTVSGDTDRADSAGTAGTQQQDNNLTTALTGGSSSSSSSAAAGGGDSNISERSNSGSKEPGGNSKATPAGGPDPMDIDAVDGSPTQDVLGELPRKIRRITHCGVAEFTADEGTVRFGPKVLFSLLGDANQDSIIEQVDVRYVQLNKYGKCRCTFQPKGAGFFLEDQTVANLDLRGVLEKQLTFHTCLTEGDVIPIRDPNENRTYYLVAKVLEPDEAVVLINTEMSIDILPSEQQEYEDKISERRKAKLERKKELFDLEVKRRKDWLEVNGPNPTPNPLPSEGRAIEIQIRLPAGKTLSRVFHESCMFLEVFAWLDSIEETMEFNYPRQDRYDLVQSWPGHKKVFLRSEAKETTLKDNGLLGKREQLFFKPHSEEEHATEGSPVDGILVGL